MDQQNVDAASLLRKKREALLQVRDILAPFGDFIAVVDGASVSSYSHEGIIKNLRETLRLYEMEHGENPDHDWSIVSNPRNYPQ